MKSCKLIYSFLYPEVRLVAEKLWDSKPHYLFDRSYQKSQEGKEVEFINDWKKWTASVLTGLEKYNNFYPTNGSSEAIREVIYQIKVQNRKLVIIENDYEGYKAFALACNLDFTVLTKEELLNYDFLPNETLVFSHPSSIDGNLYADYDKLMTKIDQKYNQTQVYVDLCYVGTIAKDYQINLNYNCIQGCFMSLSKVFGVYYHRIGGLLSKKPEAGLFGNQWFKNMFSLQLGIELMKTFSVCTLPKKTKQLQEQLCKELSSELKVEVKPCDVVILAYSKEVHPDYARGNLSRICLTPGLDLLTQEKK